MNIFPVRPYARSVALILTLAVSPPLAFAEGKCLSASQSEVSEAIRVMNSDSKRAHTLLAKASTLGNPDAAFNLGLLHMKGMGVPKSDANAASFFRNAANCGHTQAQLNLAQILYQSPAGKAEAAKWFSAAASRGNSVAAYNFGLMLSKGDGVPKDMTKATTLFTQAANLGHNDAMYNLGYIYDEGLNGAVNYALAHHYYAMAAQREHAPSQSKMAVLYGLGKGVKKDQKMAVQWLQRAAKNGDQDARRILDSM